MIEDDGKVFKLIGPALVPQVQSSLLAVCSLDVRMPPILQTLSLVVNTVRIPHLCTICRVHPQDLDEAKDNVNKRIEYVGAEMYAAVYDNSTG